jgi:hypothetical protein
MTCSQEKAGGKRWAAYAVGYGAGMGICELLILSIYLLGWGNVEGGFSPIVNLFSSWFVSLLGAAVAIIIGRQLSKKLQKHWRVAL